MVISLADTLSNISFCDKQCSNLNNNVAKDKLIKHIENTHNMQIISRQFVPLNPHMLRNISFNPHLLGTLTNGNTYLLYLIQIDGINCCFYIDRKLKNGYSYPKIHCVKYRFDNELFEKETIFNGELIRDNNRDWFFIINDILIHKGESTKDKNVISRFNLINNILTNDYCADSELEVCPLQIKRLFLYKDINDMIKNFMPNLSYVCKGIMFYTLNNKYSNYGLILPREQQIKVVESNEVDVKIKEKHPELFDSSLADIESCNTNQLTSNDIKSSFSNEFSKLNKFKLDTEINNTNNENNAFDKSLNNNDSNNNDTKNNDNHVIFKVLKTNMPDIYNLYCRNSKTDELIKYNVALIPNIDVSLALYNLFNKNTKKIEYNIICEYSNIFDRWIPVKVTNKRIFTLNQINKVINKIKSA